MIHGHSKHGLVGGITAKVEKYDGHELFLAVVGRYVRGSVPRGEETRASLGVGW